MSDLIIVENNVSNKVDFKEKNKRMKYNEPPQFQFLNSNRLEDIHNIEMKSNDGLPEELENEKIKLLADGFPEWTRKDFRIVLHIIEKQIYDSIKGEIENKSSYNIKISFPANYLEMAKSISVETGKSQTEVTRYLVMFSERCQYIPEWLKIIEKLEKISQSLVKEAEIRQLLQRTTEQYPNPMTALKLEYGVSQGKLYSMDADIYLVMSMARHGYGNWTRIRQDIQTHSLFQLDWYLRSRTANELQRRCEVLIEVLERQEKMAALLADKGE